MIPLIAAGIGAAAQIFGGQEANRANAAMAAGNQEFQMHMSNSAHQREVTDLKNAGMNPLLTLGAGASTPPGSVAQAKNTMEGLSAAANETYSNFLAAKRQKEEIELLKSQKNKTDVESKVISRGIPAADMTNQIYDMAKPVLKKIQEGVKDAAPTLREMKKDAEQLFNLRKP